jgi:hypothetical protein
MAQDHWLHGFNINCRSLALARAAFKAAIE